MDLVGNVIKYKSDRVRYTATSANDEQGARVELEKKFPGAEFIQFMTEAEYKDWRANGKYIRFGYQSTLYRKFFVFYEDRYLGELVSNNVLSANEEARKIYTDVPNLSKIFVADFQKLKYMKEKGQELLRIAKESK